MGAAAPTGPHPTSTRLWQAPTLGASDSRRELVHQLDQNWVVEPQGGMGRHGLWLQRVDVPCDRDLTASNATQCTRGWLLDLMLTSQTCHDCSVHVVALVDSRFGAWHAHHRHRHVSCCRGLTARSSRAHRRIALQQCVQGVKVRGRKNKKTRIRCLRLALTARPPWQPPRRSPTAAHRRRTPPRASACAAVVVHQSSCGGVYAAHNWQYL